MSTRGLKFRFSEGEIVLCFEPDPTKARVLYDAKVLDCQVTKDKYGRRIAAYHIHFQGWNSSWDRIVGENFILKNTDENRTLMKKLADTAKRFRKNSHRRHRIDDILKDNFRGDLPVQNSHSSNSSVDDDDSDCGNGDSIDSSDDESSNDTASETRERRRATHVPVDIEIPDILKSRLEDDYIAINHGDKMTKLAASPTVVELLEGFMKTFCVNLMCEPTEREKETRRNNGGNGTDHTLLCPASTSITLCKEFVDGLRICFDFALPIILLYDVERDQFEHVMSTMKPPELKREDKLPGASIDEPSPKKTKASNTRSRRHSEDAENEYSPRRITRRSVNLDDGLSTPPVLTLSKPERKRTPRGRGRGHAVPSPAPVVKSEPLSDGEMAGSDTMPATESKPPGFGSQNGSKDGSEHGFRREDILESVLSWQLLTAEARSQYPITPSQIYGVNHFLRIFVKLPEILNKMDMEDCKMRSLMKLVHHLLRYLVERQDELFGDIEYVDR